MDRGDWIIVCVFTMAISAIISQIAYIGGYTSISDISGCIAVISILVIMLLFRDKKER